MTVNFPQKKHEQLSADPTPSQQNYQVGKIEYLGDGKTFTLPEFEPLIIPDGFVLMPQANVDKLTAMIDDCENFHGRMNDLLRSENEGLFNALIEAVGLEPAKEIRESVIKVSRQKAREERQKNG